MPPTIVIQCYCLDDVNFYISTVCIPPEGIKKLQDIPGSLADSNLRKYYFPFTCWDKVESTLLSLNPPRRMSETVLSSEANDMDARNQENEARARAVSNLLKNLRKPSEISAEKEKSTETRTKNFLEAGSNSAGPVANRIRRDPQTMSLPSASVLPSVHVQENVDANQGKENPGKVHQTEPDSTSRQDVPLQVQIMNRDRFFIELELIPKEAYPLLDAKVIDGNRSGRAKLYSFWNDAYPRVAKVMQSLKPPLRLTNLPRWEPGLGICLSEGTTNRRVISCPGNLKCYLYDCIRFCIDYDCIPNEAISLLGNIDVRLSGPNCRERVWHFPKDHHAAILKALEIFAEIKDDPIMQFMLEPTVITSDGSICAADGYYDRKFMVPVNIMNFQRFYIEYQFIPLSCFPALSMVKTSHNDHYGKRWHFSNGYYYAVKSIFAQLLPPVLLGYVPGLKKERWKQKHPSCIEKRALSLIPKMPLNESIEHRIRIAPPRDEGSSRSGSQTAVLRNPLFQATRVVTSNLKTNTNSRIVVQSSANPTIAQYFAQNAPTIQRTNAPVPQLPKVNASVPQPTNVTTSRPQPSNVNTPRPHDEVHTSQPAPTEPQMPNPTRQERPRRIVPTRITLQKYPTIPALPVIPLQAPQSIQTPDQLPMSKPMQLQDPIVPVPRPSSSPTDNLSRTHKIEKIPGFIILKDLTPQNTFEQKANKYSAQIKIKIPPRPDNLGSNWAVIFRLAHSKYGVLKGNRDLKLKMTIANNEEVIEVPVPNARGLRFHLNITDHIRWNQENTITLKIDSNWICLEESTFFNFIGIVRHLNSNELLRELTQFPQFSVENTKEMVKNILKSTDSAISTDDSKLTVSLNCPLGKTRMITPCRSTQCKHCNCFDASNFFKLYEGSEDWKCPICTSDFLMDDLRIDGFFEIILREAEKGPQYVYADIVQIDAYGNFTICSTGQKNQSKNDRFLLKPPVIDVEEEYMSNGKIFCQDVLSDSDDSIVIISDDMVKTEKTGPGAKKETKSFKQETFLDVGTVSEDSDNMFTDSESDTSSDSDSDPCPFPVKKKLKLTNPKSKAKANSNERPVCGCKGECKSKRCACRKNNLPCTEMCHTKYSSECMNR